MAIDYLSRDGFYNGDTVQQKQEILSDTKLLKAAHEFDHEALSFIFDLYAAPLFNYALRLTSDEESADFAVGDTFAKFLDQLYAGKGPDTNLRSYLYQTTYHLIIDEARYHRREVPLEIVDYSLRNPGHRISQIPDQHEELLLLDNVYVAIREHLTEDQKHVIIFRFLEGFSLIETAEILDKEVSNIKVIQNRGIAKLKKVLGIQLE